LKKTSGGRHSPQICMLSIDVFHAHPAIGTAHGDGPELLAQ